MSDEDDEERAQREARVARYLDERARFRFRDDDVWVVTYPRSGTTWTLFLVHLIRNGGELDFAHLASVAPWFERDLALGHTTAAELDARPAPRLFKSHLPSAELPPRGRVLLVERDGRDVALSYFHLYRAYLAYHGDFDAFFARFLAGDLQYGSWLDYTRAWRAAAQEHPRLLWLRYEDLKQDLGGEVRRIARFLEVALDDETLARVVERGSFAFMKQHEARFDFARVAVREQRHLEEKRFLREGAVGRGAASLSDAQQRAYATWLEGPARPFDRERDLDLFLQ